MPETKLLATLQSLHTGEVEFILVGGLAAVLNGAPIQTYDVDLVYSLEAANIDRLLAVLESMDAIFRLQPERRLRPTKSHVAGGGHLNLLTRYGPVDLLGGIGQNLGYRHLLSHSLEMEIGEGIRIRVLDLETLIALKEQLAGEKDLAVLPVLRRTLSESKKKKDL
jgi:predicted nucleotidyltransferase